MIHGSMALMTQTLSLTEQTPAEIDTVLAANWTEQAKLQLRLQRLVADEQRAVQQIEHAIARSGEAPAYLFRNKRAIVAQITQGHADRLDLIQASAPYEAEYVNRGRWNRYFLVTNTNGHVHRGMNCVTCFSTTEYAWLPELSGCDEDEMISEFGEKACTVCFPSAPANPAFHAPGRRDREAIAAREAEKAERQAAKDAKAITDVDGSPLRIKGGYGVLRTKVAARNELSQAVQSYGWYGDSHPSDFAAQARQLVAALEAAGVETAPVIERAAKKATKEGAEHDIREVLA